ncbi:MAG: hypothetical protein HC815_41685 [Richelia sp. RM1_1_1]|nr:hypothetical protein [Richelia sp. RM1_1_1]NJN14039.1 hypothetical protein [Richelia sp. RM1_1_1]
MTNSSIQDYQFIDKKVAAKLTGLSSDTLKRYRQKGKLQKDIHWVSVNSRVVRYNKTLLIDWIQNHQSNPQAHSKAVENYLSSLPSSQKKTRQKRS